VKVKASKSVRCHVLAIHSLGVLLAGSPQKGWVRGMACST
jgi:hypothetical protein